MVSLLSIPRKDTSHDPLLPLFEGIPLKPLKKGAPEVFLPTEALGTVFKESWTWHWKRKYPRPEASQRRISCRRLRCDSWILVGAPSIFPFQPSNSGYFSGKGVLFSFGILCGASCLFSQDCSTHFAVHHGCSTPQKAGVLTFLTRGTW